jgi:acylphosphatase
MLVARRFRVTGRVQGVGYRYFAETAARAEGLSGWVQNQPDGSVEVVAEGDRESVDRFEAKLRRGPAGARVDGVQVDDDVPSGRAGEFVVSSSYGRDE